jgi:hypothetical protein
VYGRATVKHKVFTSYACESLRGKPSKAVGLTLDNTSSEAGKTLSFYYKFESEKMVKNQLFKRTWFTITLPAVVRIN